MLCERCEKEIPAERLEAMPETRICVQCSAAIGGEFVLFATAEQLGRAGSIKRVTGGVTVQKVRRTIVPLRCQEQ